MVLLATAGICSSISATDRPDGVNVQRVVSQIPITMGGADIITRTVLIGVLDNITKLIQSPPGHMVAGSVLAGIVWKFFERIEAILTEQTKLEIANWLRGVKTADHVPWPETFAKVFDRVFGTKHLSWKCFWRSCIATYSAILLCASMSCLLHYQPLLQARPALEDVVLSICVTLCFTFFTNVIPDYIALLITRLSLRFMGRTHSISRIGLALVIGFAVPLLFLWFNLRQANRSGIALIDSCTSHAVAAAGKPSQPGMQATILVRHVMARSMKLEQQKGPEEYVAVERVEKPMLAPI